MKTMAITGSRSIKDYQDVKKVLDKYKPVFEKMGVTHVNIGMADGIDILSKCWFEENTNIVVNEMPANWYDLDGVPPEHIAVNSRGRKYNTQAGMERNVDMERASSLLMAIWDGKSNGTRHMVNLYKRNGKPYLLEILDGI